MVSTGIAYRNNYYDAINGAIKALKLCDLKVIGVNPDTGMIIATSGILSYGEILEVRVREIEGGAHVSFDPGSGLQFLGVDTSTKDHFFAHLNGIMQQMIHSTNSFFLSDKDMNNTNRIQDIKSQLRIDPNPSTPALMASINGAIAVLVGLYFLIVLDMTGVLFFELLIFIMCASLFIGSGLVAAKAYRIGAVFCVIGGAITIPIGMLSIIAATQAWNYYRFQNPKKDKIPEWPDPP